MRAPLAIASVKRTERDMNNDLTGGIAPDQPEPGELHVVVGAGPIGSGIARILAAEGRHVIIVTRSGSGPEGVVAERVATDASDSGTIARLAEGAAALYNCVNPPYHRWPELWPPIAGSLLGAPRSIKKK